MAAFAYSDRSGFMVAATASGWWLADHGKQRFFPTLVVLVGLAALASASLPMTRPPQRQAGEDAASLRSLLATVLVVAGGQDVALVLLCTLPVWVNAVSAGAARAHSMGGHDLERGGRSGDRRVLTCGWFFKRMPAHQVLTLALAASLIRWTLLGLFPNPYVIVATQLLHGPSFALYYAAAMQELGDFAGKRFHASLQGLFATGVNGVAYVSAPPPPVSCTRTCRSTV